MMEEDEEFRRLVRRGTGSDVDLVVIWVASVVPAGLLSTAGPWWRVLGALLIIAGGVVMFWWQWARYAAPDWPAILGALGGGRPRQLARALSPLLIASGAWYFGALTITLGVVRTWDAIQQAVDPQPPASRVRRVTVLVSSPLNPGALTDLDLDAARRWPSLVRHDLQLALEGPRPFIASIPGVDAKDPRMRSAARDDARALEHDMCGWSMRYPEIKFAFIKGECRGTRCDYRGHVCQNDMPVAGSDGGPDGATELLKHVGVELSDDLMAVVLPAPRE